MSRTPVMTLSVVIAVLGALWFTNGAVTPKEATWDDVLAEAKTGGYRIITTQELGVAYSKNPNEFLLVDTRQEWEYRTGHISGCDQLPDGTDLVVALAQGGRAERAAWPGQRPEGRFLLSGLDLSPQRLGGPGGRSAWV